MKKIYSYLLLISLFHSIRIQSNNPPIGFIENKGQIHDQNFNPNPTVKYLLSTPGMNIQLKANGFSYETYTLKEKCETNSSRLWIKKFSKPETQSIYQFQRVDINFIGANEKPEIIAYNSNGADYNFYINSNQGITNIKCYSKILYKNIYSNIDLEFLIENNKVKYNFIIRPGGNFKEIRWSYSGSEKSEIVNNEINIVLVNGIIKEEIPSSYIASANSKTTKREVKYKFFGNSTFGFDSPESCSIKKGETFIIDPTLTLLWATYFGGTKTEFISSSCIDGAGNTYYMGVTSSLASVATIGAYQTTYGGGAYDAMLFKFNLNGALQWATYFGGTMYEDGWGVVIDKSNNLFVCGYTNGSTTFTTSGAHQTVYGGGSKDVYLSKFTNSGTLIWSTYYGGTGEELSYSCQLDTLGNVFLGGITSSTNAISTAGSYQVNYGGGTYDGFIAKFNTNGVRQWATYYGGPGEDAPQYCQTDKNNCVYLGGYSTSSVSISSPGSYQSNFSGGWDCFLAKFSPNGSRLWSTYYGDTGDEYIVHINCDSLNNVYITGPTSSSVGIASAGAHQTVFGGVGSSNIGDAFLVKFDSSGVRQWGTYYGGGNDEGGSCIGISGPYVFICGSTQSPNQISTIGTYQDLYTNPYADMFLVKFNMAGVRQWGTYLGGSVNDIPYFMLISPLKEIYLCGTSDGPFPVTPGAYQTTLNGLIEGVIVKFRENSLGTGIIESDLQSNDLFLFPNPNNGSFTIKTNEDASLTITNELGQIIMTIILNESNNHSHTVSDLPSGIYSISSTGRIGKKVIVVE